MYSGNLYQDASSLSLLASVMLTSATGQVNTLRNRAIILLQNLMPAGNSEIMTLDLSVGMSTAVAHKGFMKYFFCNPPYPAKVLRGCPVGSDLNLFRLVKV